MVCKKGREGLQGVRPPVMICRGFTGSQRLGQGNGSSVAGAAVPDIFALARSISQPSSCRKLPCP